RRRHTRSDRDWSSDVCSSDLDIAGSTAIGEALGLERSKYLFDEVMRLVAAEVERYGGTVAQLAGDGLLAVFGAPVAHEDDSERRSEERRVGKGCRARVTRGQH